MIDKTTEDDGKAKRHDRAKHPDRDAPGDHVTVLVIDADELHAGNEQAGGDADGKKRCESTHALLPGFA